MTNEKPVKKFQAGGISAALWKNKLKLKSGQEIETLSVTLDRRYRDDNGEWKSSSSLRANDIPKAVLVMQQAYQYMVTKNTDDAVITEEEAVV